MSLVECHPKTWQATLSQAAAQEVTNLHQHWCAGDSAGAGAGAGDSDSAGVSALICTNTAQNQRCNTQYIQ